MRTVQSTSCERTLETFQWYHHFRLTEKFRDWQVIMKNECRAISLRVELFVKTRKHYFPYKEPSPDGGLSKRNGNERNRLSWERCDNRDVEKDTALNLNDIHQMPTNSHTHKDTDTHTHTHTDFSDRSFLKILIFSTIYGRFRGGQVNLPHPPPW